MFWSSGIAIACFCLCVRLCLAVCINHELVCVITCDPFKLGWPTSDQMSKTPGLKSLLLWVLIDLELQVQISLKCHFELAVFPVHSTTTLTPHCVPNVIVVWLKRLGNGSVGGVRGGIHDKVDLMMTPIFFQMRIFHCSSNLDNTF